MVGWAIIAYQTNHRGDVIMEVEDYYAALNISRTATIKDIRKAFRQMVKDASASSREAFALAVEAQGVLTNRYKRARYDRLLGHLMVIQVFPEPYSSAIVYQLNSTTPFSGLQNIIMHFKDWIQKKFNLDWEEAVLGNYSYNLLSGAEEPYFVKYALFLY